MWYVEVVIVRTSFRQSGGGASSKWAPFIDGLRSLSSYERALQAKSVAVHTSGL